MSRSMDSISPADGVGLPGGGLMCFEALRSFPNEPTTALRAGSYEERNSDSLSLFDSWSRPQVDEATFSLRVFPSIEESSFQVSPCRFPISLLALSKFALAKSSERQRDQMFEDQDERKNASLVWFGTSES